MLKIKNEEWKLFFENLNQPVFVTDRELNIIYSNRSISNLLDTDDFIGKSFNEFLNNVEVLSNLPEHFIENLKKISFAKSLEFEIRKGNEYYQLNFNPIYSENGEIDKLICIATKITNKKIVEEELRKAKEKAENSSKMKSSFLANMSHEVRTPLNGIIGFSSMLDNDNLSSEKRKLYIDYIHKGAHQLMTIINDIIDFSKIDAGLLEIKKQPVNVVELINDQIVYFRNEIEKQNKEIVIRKRIIDIDKNLIINADEIRLRQVLSNLLSNAIKFTYRGYIEVGLLIKNSNLLFYVKDTGIGIEKDKLDIVFERFKQLHNSYSREYKGSGLGLAICKALVNLMGGKIWVESEKDVGSVFYFTIPLELVKSVKNSKTIKNRKMPTINYNFKNKKILIIEDDLYNIEYLKAVLQPSECDLLIANDFEETKKKLSKEISVVLLDIRLPEKDGFFVADYIRKYFPELPIIIHTAHALEEDIEKAMKKGFNEYLIKPVKPEVLLNTISKYIFNECYSG